MVHIFTFCVQISLTGMIFCLFIGVEKHFCVLWQDPVPYIVAEPLPSNLLEWHYVVRGPDDSPYRGNTQLGLHS